MAWEEGQKHVSKNYEPSFKDHKLERGDPDAYNWILVTEDEFEEEDESSGDEEESRGEQ